MGLGPVGVEDLFLVNSNEEATEETCLKEAITDCSNVPETIKFDEGILCD